ncbi:hypothetical protein [Thalassospira sp.]|uniref:hypothetical protein n=1 Tax=Thalassospira sp. TaxID=1912094 RepID=UPI003AA8E710
MWKTIIEVWERILFSIVGFTLIIYALRLIYLEKITTASAVFGIGFLSFIYANVSRFKKFKGLGFEAELWEDKQKEAADLIDRLRFVVSIYTREIILGKVKQGRLGPANSWKDRWKLYNDLISEHTVLGQKIDFADVKKEMDDYFLFDLTYPRTDKIRRAISEKKNVAQQKIDAEFGTPIRDISKHRVRVTQLKSIKDRIENPLETSASGNLAQVYLNIFNTAKQTLKRDFDINLQIEDEIIETLEELSQLYQHRPVVITNRLIQLADNTHQA